MTPHSVLFDMGMHRLPLFAKKDAALIWVKFIFRIQDFTKTFMRRYFIR